MKKCSLCKEEKPLGDFHRNQRTRDRHFPSCKECRNAANRAYAKTGAGLDKRRIANRKWGRENPDKVRNKRLRYLFGITHEDYETRLLAQGNVCAICRRSCATGRRLNVDHDHQTGLVRGLLCWACNVGIGKLGDSFERVKSAAEYLRRSA